MLQYLSTEPNTNEEWKKSAYLELGSELFFFGFVANTFQLALEEGLFEKKTRVNIFLTQISESYLQELAQMIQYLYEKKFEQDSSRINLYFPANNICDCLELHQTPCKYYNFFVNLWDEIPVDGVEQMIEYMFQEETQDQEKKRYWIQVEVPKQFDFCFGK